MHFQILEFLQGEQGRVFKDVRGTGMSQDDFRKWRVQEGRRSTIQLRKAPFATGLVLHNTKGLLWPCGQREQRVALGGNDNSLKGNCSRGSGVEGPRLKCRGGGINKTE